MMDPDGITRGTAQTESGTNSNLRQAQREEQFKTDPGSELRFKDKEGNIFYRSVRASKNKSAPVCFILHTTAACSYQNKY
jgi:hypothetical protein